MRINPPTNGRQFFKACFGFTPPFVVEAPGCVELLGSLAEFNQGLTMTIPVDKGVQFAASPRGDGKIELVCSDSPGRASFSVSRIEPQEVSAWANPLKSLLLMLRQRGVHFSGFNGAVFQQFPTSLPLGGPAAMLVALALVLRKIYPYAITSTGTAQPPVRDKTGEITRPLRHQEKVTIARLCQTALTTIATGDNRAQSAQVAALTAISGRQFHVAQVDCQEWTVELNPLAAEIGLVLGSVSGLPDQAKTIQAKTIEIQQACESACQKLRVKALRRIDVPTLTASQSRLTEREYQCAYHQASETRRVIFAERALREMDIEQFGRYMCQSHESAHSNLLYTTPELACLVDLARARPDCLGARLMGPGFGAAVVMMVLAGQLKEFCHWLTNEFEQRAGQKIDLAVCRAADGAH